MEVASHEVTSYSNTNEFEFGCITPNSPFSDPYSTISPADQFFFNGRLLPHSFPIKSRKSTSSDSHSRATSSRGSSIGSSLMSSRSNSTSSNRSGTTSCSSARTSASDSSERKAFQKKLARRTVSANERLYGNYYGPCSGSPRKWQFIAEAPVMDPGLSRRRRSSPMELGLKGKLGHKKNVDGEGVGFCKRILRSFVGSCRACHAMENVAIEIK